MKRSPFLGVLLLCAMSAAAQPVTTVPKNIRAANTIDNLFDVNGLSVFDNLYGIPMEPGAVRGNAYLNQDWRRTTFLLYGVDKLAEGYLSRYEIRADQFEIKITGGLRVLNGNKVKSFVWLDSLTGTPHYFVNARDFKPEQDIPRNGFFEVLAEGTLSLLARTEATVIKPSYNAALDMGNRDARIVREVSFFYSSNGRVSPLPSSKKKLLPIFGSHAPGMEKFIRVNALSLTEPRHLKVLFDHYNALITDPSDGGFLPAP